MKTTIKTIEFTAEKRETAYLNRRREYIRTFCKVCGVESEMSTTAILGERFSLSRQSIFGLIAAEIVGFHELPNGSLLVCLNCVEVLPGKC